jgi:hypothetical protein
MEMLTSIGSWKITTLIVGFLGGVLHGLIDAKTRRDWALSLISGPFVALTIAPGAYAHAVAHGWIVADTDVLLALTGIMAASAPLVIKTGINGISFFGRRFKSGET